MNYSKEFSSKYFIKVACRVQIWKKAFCQNIDYFYNIMFMYLLCIYQKTIILSLFKIRTLNFIMYILTILTCPLKHMSLDYII